LSAAELTADSTMKYSITSSGCLMPTTSGKWYASVNLPDNSEISYISISYYNDQSSHLSTVRLTRYAKDGNFYDLTSMDSKPGGVTGAGYFSDISPKMANIEVVDNYTYAYAFVWSGRIASIKM
jgi:hypothetical protein